MLAGDGVAQQEFDQVVSTCLNLRRRSIWHIAQ